MPRCRGLRIGVPNEYFSAGLDPRIAELVHNSVKELEKLGAVIKHNQPAEHASTRFRRTT